MIFTYRTKEVLDITKLSEELCSNISAIHSVVLLGPDQVRICSVEELSEEDLATVDTVLTDFVDRDPSLDVPRIMKYAKQEAASKHFHNILYTGPKETTLSFIPKRTIQQGEVVKVEWFAYRDADGLQEKILDVDIVYTRDASSFAISRTTTRTWYAESGEPIADTKITTKYYDINTCDMVTEGVRRRKLLVDNIQIPMISLMMEILLPQGYTEASVLLMGREFLDNYTDYINKFVENTSTITDPSDPNYGKKSICVALGEDSDHSWLDKAPATLGGATTIRQYLINEFSI